MSLLDYKISEAMKRVKNKNGYNVKLKDLEAELTKIRIKKDDVPMLIKKYGKGFNVDWKNR